jgi:hypothetical protein
VSAWAPSYSSAPSVLRLRARSSGTVRFHVARSLAVVAADSSSNSETGDEVARDGPPPARKQGRKPSTKKFKVVDKIEQHHLDKLSKAFDDLARKEGLDSDLAFFADEEGFLDDEDDHEEFEFSFPDDDDDEEEEDDANDDEGGRDTLESRTRGLPDWTEPDDDDDDSMESRIAAAARERDTGKVVVPRELDELATSRELRKLGFQRESNPFGNDETPRKEQFATLLRSPLTCPACGSKFQCDDESRPGFIPQEKYATQLSLSKLEEVQRIQLKAESDDLEWSPEDEVEWLIQQQQLQQQQQQQQHEITSAEPSTSSSVEMDVDSMAQEMELDLVELSQQKPVICKRCHGLQNFGKVEDKLRPGWTDEPMLSQEKFRNLLKPLRDRPAVIIALVDLFDFSGSVLPELDSIAGSNPVIVAANKVDLLPDKMGPTRVESWVRRELEYLGVRSLANIGGAVRLVSCRTGEGVDALMGKARALAEEMNCDIYVVGAANAGKNTSASFGSDSNPTAQPHLISFCFVLSPGKSTLLNHIIGPSSAEDRPSFGKRRAGNANKRKGMITTSPLPGTTLEFIKIDLADGRSLYDTPGLLVPGTLTQILTPDELKIVVPKK